MRASAAESFLRLLGENLDIIAGPVVTLVYPLLPFWSYAKLIFICWLVIPYFSGAAYVYKHFVRPYLVTRQKSVNIWFVPHQKDVFNKPDDIITAAEKYMEANGTEAFEKMIKRTNRETTSSVNGYTNNHALYDDDYRYEDEHRY
ncbi:hypothetical protein ACS0TY_006838 [Phlomoides rotata]